MRAALRWLAIVSLAVAAPALAQSTLASSGGGITAGSNTTFNDAGFNRIVYQVADGGNHHFAGDQVSLADYTYLQWDTSGNSNGLVGLVPSSPVNGSAQSSGALNVVGDLVVGQGANPNSSFGSLQVNGPLANIRGTLVGQGIIRGLVVDAGAYYFGDGTVQTTAGSYWQTVHECDFTTDTVQTFVDDAGYTLCGETWQAMNVTSINGINMTVGANGLRIKPSTASDWYNTTRTKPGIKRTVTDLFGSDVSYDTPLRGCFYVGALNAAANYDKIAITFTSPNGVINIYGGGVAYTAGAPFTPTQFHVANGGAGGFANITNTAPYSTDDVVCIELPLGIQGGVYLAYSGDWSDSGNTWPTAAYVHPTFRYTVATAANATSIYWASSGATLDKWIATLGCTRAGSLTDLTCDIHRMIWQKRTGAW